MLRFNYGNHSCFCSSFVIHLRGNRRSLIDSPGHDYKLSNFHIHSATNVMTNQQKRYIKEQLLKQAYLIVEYPDSCPEFNDEDRDYAYEVIWRMAKAVGIDEF